MESRVVYERKSRDNATLSGLSRAEIVKKNRLLMEFWPSIGDGGFNVGNIKVASIRNPRVKLAHRCIATTISGRKENTNRVTEIDLYYLYFIYTEGVVCNIPYWLAKYLKSVRDKTVEEDEAEEEAEGEAANTGAGGSAEMYQNMSQSAIVQVRGSHDWLYLMRRSLEVLKKFHWMILGGRFNQLSHVSSPLLSKPGEY
ncbi:hypothetical protein Tco_0196188 [Tanacetum coccineum]